MKQAWFDGTAALEGSDLDHTEVVQAMLAKGVVEHGGSKPPLWIYCLQKLATTLFDFEEVRHPSSSWQHCAHHPRYRCFVLITPQNPSKPLANVLSPFEIVFALTSFRDPIQLSLIKLRYVNAPD